jgi:hypothetical protein
VLQIYDSFTHLSHLALVLFLNLGHFLGELFLTESDGLLLTVMNLLGFSITLDELVL